LGSPGAPGAGEGGEGGEGSCTPARASELVPEPDPKLPGPTLVEQVFGGVLCSGVLCSSCGHQSVRGWAAPACPLT
jgi:hypothetical protein